MRRLFAIFILICVVSAPLVGVIVFLKLCGHRIVSRASGLEQSKEFKYFYMYAPENVDMNVYAKHGEKFMDALFNTYEERFLLRRPSTKLHIYLFETHEQFREHSWEDFKKDLIFNSGFYNPFAKKIALILDIEGEDKFGALRHEIFHALLDMVSVNARWSPWFNEGLTCCFENTEVVGDKLVVKPPVKILKSLPDDWIPLISIRELIRISQRAFETSANIVVYRNSYLLVYFLFSQKKEKFYQYYREELKPGVVLHGEFESIFGDIDMLEKEWVKFILREKQACK